MPTRIYEALSAIEQRRLSPIEAGGIEDRAMVDTQRGLLTLKAERTASVSEFNLDFAESRQPHPTIRSKCLNSSEP